MRRGKKREGGKKAARRKGKGRKRKRLVRTGEGKRHGRKEEKGGSVDRGKLRG